jgi:HlyD family secretion protein
LLVIAGAITTYVYLKPPGARPDVLLHTVKRESLDVTVSEKGTLESANNIDVICKVRAGNKGFATSINWVIDDGSKVKKDQLLMVLDDSALQDQSRDQRVKVDQALSAKVTAEKQYDITVKSTEQSIAKAENDLLGAQIDMEKFFGFDYDPANAGTAAVTGVFAQMSESGGFRQSLDDLSGKVRQTEGDVEQNRERSAWADRMQKMKYFSAAQAQAERSRLDSSVETLRSLKTQLQLLLTFDRKKQLATLQSNVDNFQRALDQAKLEADAKRAQADIDRKTKINIYNNEAEKQRDIEDQIKECKIHAPQDGMVVYYKNDSNRFGNTPTLIEQGAQVKEGQKMLRIPNLERMQVNTKVHEAMVSRIKGDVRIATNFVEKLNIGLLATIDPLSRLVTHKEDVQQSLRDHFKNIEYRTAEKGQEATIKVDAMQEKKLRGRVKTVARVASQADSFISDVKLYPTIVLIEDHVDGLNPDMSAEVTIHIRGITDVLTIPLQAVVGGSELGTKRKVFVKTATGYDEKDISLGIYNDKVIEVREGLNEGDEVVLNPKVLLGESKQKTRDGTGQGSEAGKGGGKGNGGNAPVGTIPGEEKKGFDPSKKRGPKGGGGFQPQG